MSCFLVLGVGCHVYCLEPFHALTHGAAKPTWHAPFCLELAGEAVYPPTASPCGMGSLGSGFFVPAVTPPLLPRELKYAALKHDLVLKVNTIGRANDVRTDREVVVHKETIMESLKAGDHGAETNPPRRQTIADAVTMCVVFFSQ